MNSRAKGGSRVPCKGAAVIFQAGEEGDSDQGGHVVWFLGLLVQSEWHVREGSPEARSRPMERQSHKS